VSEPFLGEIKMFAGNFAPRGYALANGQLLSIAQNTALFALYGTTYGGDGRVTFGLPDLQGRAPMEQGQGAGLTPRDLGESAGTPTVTLLATEIPPHTHTMSGEDNEATQVNPVGNAFGVGTSGNLYTTAGAPGLQLQPMSGQTVAPNAGGQPHNNQQPYLAITFIVAVQGIFPARN